MIRICLWLATLAGLILCATGCGERETSAPKTIPLVPSTQLKQTTIVPTLDTPLEKSGNVVWCATFQVAWHEANDKVIGSPLQLANAQAIADRLNASPVRESALPPGRYYLAAGRMKDGIVAKIHKDMAAKYPHVPPVKFDSGSGIGGLVTYAYLETVIKFSVPFVDTEKPLTFTDANGETQQVAAFGLFPPGEVELREKQAQQVKVLFTRTAESKDGIKDFNFDSFALDMTANNAKQQLIIAVLPRGEHLQATLDDLNENIEHTSLSDLETKIQVTDLLRIPNVALNTLHKFVELIGPNKPFLNPGEFQGMSIVDAFQSIKFQLDKGGVILASEAAYVAWQSIPRYFVVDRPFLIVLKRRDQDQPYFVAWVENAELLER